MVLVVNLHDFVDACRLPEGLHFKRWSQPDGPSITAVREEIPGTYYFNSFLIALERESDGKSVPIEISSLIAKDGRRGEISLLAHELVKAIDHALIELR